MDIDYLAKLKKRGRSFLEEAAKGGAGEIKPNNI